MATRVGQPHDVKFSAADAKTIAKEIIAVFRPRCHKLIVAGSLRRRCDQVSDIEILFIPQYTLQRDPDDLFDHYTFTSQADVCLNKLLDLKLLAKRPTIDGLFTWGPMNKLATHQSSGIPVDFFSSDNHTWPNFLVVRTGPVSNNKRIAAEAIKHGWHWNAYGTGFTNIANPSRHHTVKSERDVYNFVGLPYLHPWERE